MSARGSLVTNPGSHPHLISESKSFIPLFWLSFLTADDLGAAERPGQYVLDRKEAIERGATKVSLYAESFADIPEMTEFAEALLDLMRSKKSKTIGIEITELVPQEDDILPPLEFAVQAVQGGSVRCTRKIPARSIRNPFTGEQMNVPEKTFRSLRDILLAVCMVGGDDLQSSEPEEVRDYFVGYLWE